MNRIITSIVLIGLSCFLAIFGYFNLKSICEDEIINVKEIITAIEETDDDKIKKAVENTTAFWNKKNKLMGIYINHSEMDEIQINIKSLDDLCKSKDYEELLEISYNSIYHLEHIGETENPSIGNIF
ncbi:MAG: DUF4363 family protein [Oscillospiraceae bacterium]